MAVLSIKTLGGHSDLGQTAERLAGKIQLASQNARLEDRQYGLRIEAHRYEFMRFNGRGWNLIMNDPVLAIHSLPKAVTLDIQVRGNISIPVPSTAPTIASASAAATAATSDAGMTSGDNSQTMTPQVVILSTGEITPFTLTMATSTTTYVVNGDGNGQIHVVPPGTDGSPAAG